MYQTYQTKAEAVDAGKQSETADFHRAIAIARMNDGSFMYCAPEDSPVYIDSSDRYVYGSIVARFVFSDRSRKWQRGK